MERQLPRNVRQIGNVSDNPKIYMEDYVDTFITQLCQRTEEEPVGAFFVGESVRMEDRDCIFVSGALEMENISVDGNKVVWGEETWKNGTNLCKEYFPGQKMIGWYLSTTATGLSITDQLLHLHERRFGKGHTFFVLRNAVENEEVYYAYKYRDLMPLGGHYIYYEKNPAMQNYMVRTRSRNGATPLETYEDRATQDFRNIVGEHLAEKENKHRGRLLYTTCAALVLVVLVGGITLFNNYDRMKEMQSSVEALSDKVKDTSVAANEDAAKSDQESQTPKKEQVPSTETTETPDTAAASGTPDTAAASGTPDIAAASGTPETAGTPDTAAASGTPETAGTPDTAATSGTPETQATLASVREVYTVQAGDTLASISEKAYGTIGRVDEICSMNGLEDSNRIYEGEKLWLPE